MDNFYKTNYEKGGCYPQPLKLTNDDDSHYLEVEVVRDNPVDSGNTLPIQFVHWNKNKGLQKQKYYKGKSWHSIDSINTKRGALIGTYTRIDRNTSNKTLYQEALEEKKKELENMKLLMKDT